MTENFMTLMNGFRDKIFILEQDFKKAKIIIKSFNIDTETSIDTFRDVWSLCLHKMHIVIEFIGQDAEKVMDIFKKNGIGVISIETFDRQTYIITGSI